MIALAWIILLSLGGLGWPFFAALCLCESDDPDYYIKMFYVSLNGGDDE